MPVFVSQLLSQLKNIWAQLSGSQRLTVSAVLAATLVGFVTLVYYGTRPEYVPFGNDLEGDDKRALIAALESGQVDYHAEGDSILVNSKDIHSASTVRLRQGLGSGSESEGAAPNLFMPKDLQRHWLQKAKAGEIARTVRSLHGVKQARVIQHSPKRSIFAGRTAATKPSASVMVSLSDRDRFKKIASAAVGIVSTGLGIPRQSVTVISSDGQEFVDSSGSTGAAGGGGSTLLELETRASNLMTAKAQMGLEVLFPGKTMVQVHVSYDNLVEDSTEKIVSTDKIVTEKTSYKTSSKHGATGTGGDPNVGSMVGGASAAPGAVAASGGPESSTTQSKEKFEPILGTRTRRQLSPAVERVAISLSIDESLASQKEEIISLVKASVGWDDKRDAAVSALVAKFPEPEPITEPGGGIMEMLKTWAPTAAQVISVLLVLLFLRSLLKKQGTAAPAMASVTEADEDDDPGRATKRLRREIEKTVSRDPGSVSRLLETWLTDKKEPA